MARYFAWTSFRNVRRSGFGASEVDLGVLLPGCESSPWPSPKPTGRSIDIAGLLKTAAGSVIEGIYDILTGL